MKNWHIAQFGILHSLFPMWCSLPDFKHAYLFPHQQLGEQPAAIVPVLSAGRQGARRQLLRWQLVAAGEPSTVALPSSLPVPAVQPYPSSCQVSLLNPHLKWNTELCLALLLVCVISACKALPRSWTVTQRQHKNFSKLRSSEKKSTKSENGRERQEQVVFTPRTRTNSWG